MTLPHLVINETVIMTHCFQSRNDPGDDNVGYAK